MSETWTDLLAAHEAAHEAGGDGQRDGLPEHAPVAAVVACSDARVPPSAVFDQPAGRLFVVRTAGNTATPSTIASLDYAVDGLGVPLVVVLGHTDCGAVAAAADGHCGDHLHPVTHQICEVVDADRGGSSSEPAPPVDLTELSGRNVRETLARLAASPSPLGQAVQSGRTELVGALYDLTTGTVVPVGPPTDHPTIDCPSTDCPSLDHPSLDHPTTDHPVTTARSHP
ncbi:MAG: carbonic anhydrase [Actinomycetota bacterium]